MTIKQKKEKTKQIIYELEAQLKKIKLPIDKEGNLNLKDFNNLPEVRKVSAKLKGMNISRHWLYDYGFAKTASVLSLGETLNSQTLKISNASIIL